MSFKFSLGEKVFGDKGYGIVVARFSNSNNDNVYYLNHKDLNNNSISIKSFEESKLEYPILRNL